MRKAMESALSYARRCSHACLARQVCCRSDSLLVFTQSKQTPILEPNILSFSSRIASLKLEDELYVHEEQYGPHFVIVGSWKETILAIKPEIPECGSSVARGHS